MFLIVSDCLLTGCETLSRLQTPDYQSKKKLCRRLRHKLFHIKRRVKDYDKSHS